MTKYPSERTAALINEALAIWERIEKTPQSPVFGFLPKEARGEYRRRAKRLRRRQLVPIFENLNTGDSLADVYERTADRDQTLEQAGKDLIENGRKMRQVVAEEGEDATIRTFNMMFIEAEDAAKIGGDDSEAWHRYRRMRVMIGIGTKAESDERRGKSGQFYVLPHLLNPATQARWEATAATFLTSPPPPGETVFSFPEQDTGVGRGRLLMRIGVGNASWVGSFERGNKGGSAVQWMPDLKHIFVCAAGAGYMIDASTRKLVEKVGNDVVAVAREEDMELFIVTHDDELFEAFGPTGSVWKTRTLGCGGFRGLKFEGDDLVGEARQRFVPEWVPFAVKLATGEVSFRGLSS